MLDNELKVLLKLTQNTSYLTIGEAGVAQVRRNVKALAAVTSLAGTVVETVKECAVAAEDGATILLRIYRPRGGNGRMPALVFFHGGGFVLYDLDDYDGFCRFLAAAAGIIIIAVDYRRAPEHIFPQSHEDAVLAVDWVFANAERLGIDAYRIAAGGDSAGGNLAVHVSFARAGAGCPVCLQLLIYPVLGFNRPFPSYDEYGNGYFLNKSTIDWFWGLIRNKDLSMDSDLRLHPYRHPDISGLPPTIMVTAEYDILRDEGIGFHDRLVQEGKDSQLLYFDRLGHNFILMAGRNKASAEAILTIAGTIHEKIYR